MGEELQNIKISIKLKEKNIFKRIYRFFFPKYIEINDFNNADVVKFESEVQNDR